MANYTFNNTPFSEEELIEVADSKGYTLDELFEKNPGIKETDPDEEGKETPSQETVDATVEVDDTASNLGNGSLESQEIDNSPEAIKSKARIQSSRRNRNNARSNRIRRSRSFC